MPPLLGRQGVYVVQLPTVHVKLNSQIVDVFQEEIVTFLFCSIKMSEKLFFRFPKKTTVRFPIVRERRERENWAFWASEKKPFPPHSIITYAKKIVRSVCLFVRNFSQLGFRILFFLVAPKCMFSKGKTCKYSFSKRLQKLIKGICPVQKDNLLFERPNIWKEIESFAGCYT